MLEWVACNSPNIIIHLMSAPEGDSLFCFPESLNVSLDEVEVGAGNNFSLVARRDTLHLSGVTWPQISQSRLLFTLAI
jgi:hypothetical protein